MRIPLHLLLLQANEPPVRAASLGYFLDMLRHGGEPHAAEVTPAPGYPGVWRILNGRHRFLASVITGRPDLLCEPKE